MGEDRLKSLARTLRQREQTSRAIEIASTKQKRMMPEPPKDIPGVEFAASYTPAAQISGDFYDFFPTPENNVGVVLGDVSGHGIECGIVMGMAKQTLKIYGSQIAKPDEVLKASNASLHEGLDGKTFVSLSYGVLTPRGMMLSYARAGQSKPIHYNPKWGDVLPQVISSRGMPLGVDPGRSFDKVIQEIRFQLRPGDVFFQYTDGIIEAANSGGEQYGEKRLVELIARYARAGAQELLDIVRESLRDFTGKTEYEDDITMIALRVRPASVTRIVPKLRPSS